MFATGMPALSTTFLSAASMSVSIPSGIQIFAWIATIWAARRPVLATPMLFMLGFICLFVIGGVSGVMTASVPFDWQATDTYFVVAHLHYVLVGVNLLPDARRRAARHAASHLHVSGGTRLGLAQPDRVRGRGGDRRRDPPLPDQR